jgi:hypothetical protein
MHAKYLGPNKVQVLYEFGTDKWHSYPEGTEVPPGSPLVPKFLSLAEARAMWPDLVVWGGEKPVEATAGVDYEEIDRELAALGASKQPSAKKTNEPEPRRQNTLPDETALHELTSSAAIGRVLHYLEILAAKVEASTGRRQKAYKLQYEHSREMALKCGLVTASAIQEFDAQAGCVQAPVVLS